MGDKNKKEETLNRLKRMADDRKAMEFEAELFRQAEELKKLRALISNPLLKDRVWERRQAMHYRDLCLELIHAWENYFLPDIGPPGDEDKFDLFHAWTDTVKRVKEDL